MASALLLYHDRPVQIIVTGDRSLSDDAARAMVDLVRSSLLPSKVLILADGDTGSVLYRGGLDVLRDIDPSASPGTAFVCRDLACSAPVRSVEELKELLKVE